MISRRLGKTNLSLPVIGLGGWALGGGMDWGNTSFDDVSRTVSAALDAGITLIDTAPIYGDSEAVLGRALQGRRAQVLLSTKCGLVKNGSWTDHDLSADTMARQLETSLKNLQTDYLDIYWVHYLDPRVPWQEVLERFARLKQQGKIRAVGVCNVLPDILREMAQTGQIDCVQDELSLLHPAKGLAALDVCREYNLGFVAYGALCGGILSGKYKREPNFRRADARNYFYKCYRGEAFAQAQQTVSRVQNLAQQKGVCPAQISLAWVLAQPGVTCVLVGARSAEQVRQNAVAADVSLSAEELCSLTK